MRMSFGPKLRTFVTCFGEAQPETTLIETADKLINAITMDSLKKALSLIDMLFFFLSVGRSPGTANIVDHCQKSS